MTRSHALILKNYFIHIFLPRASTSAVLIPRSEITESKKKKKMYISVFGSYDQIILLKVVSLYTFKTQLGTCSLMVFTDAGF